MNAPLWTVFLRILDNDGNYLTWEFRDHNGIKPNQAERSRLLSIADHQFRDQYGHNATRRVVEVLPNVPGDGTRHSGGFISWQEFTEENGE